MLAAIVAGVSLAASHTMMPTLHIAALFAVTDRDTTGPTGVKNVIQAGIIIGKFAVEIRNRVLLIAGYRIGLLTLHNRSTLSTILLVVKVYI